MKEKNKKVEGCGARKKDLMLLAVAVFFIASMFMIIAVPIGPESIAYNFNTTKNVTGALIVNISGGVISFFNLTASVQNPRWKAFVGQVFGMFTLDDSNDNTIYDWTLDSYWSCLYHS